MMGQAAYQVDYNIIIIRIYLIYSELDHEPSLGGIYNGGQFLNLDL